MKLLGVSPPARTGGATNRWHLRYLVPTLAILAITTLVPAAYTVYLSLTTSGSESFITREFSGAGSYSRLLTDPQFWNAFVIQLVFVAGAVTSEVVIGFLIALALNRPGRFTRLVRTVLLAPAVLPPIVVALLFSYLLQSRIGAISYYAERLGITSDWFGQGSSALGVLIAVDAWQFTPVVAILILAGLQHVPAELLEAAMIDGAGIIRRVTAVIIPFLLPALTTIGLLRLIDAVQVFPTIYVLTNGGPGESTNALNFWGFTVFFKLSDTTYGAAIAVVLTLGTVVLAFAIGAALRKQLKL